MFLYGPPAAGKLTVARLLAERTGFRVLHNHVTIDAVLPLFAFGTPPFFELVGSFRRALVATAARERLDLIYTFVYAAEVDDDHVAEIVGSYERAGGRVTLVQLYASRETLLARVGSESRRAHSKLTDPDALGQILDRHDLYTPVTGRTSLTIDTSELTAEQAAAMIADRLREE